MKTKDIIILTIAALTATTLYYSFRGNSSNPDYLASVNKERRDKDEYMKSGEDSPFGEQRKNFKGLNYFPPDVNYRISANLIPVEKKKMVLLPASDGSEKKYLEYAFAEFELNNILCRLLILEVVDDNYRGTLFLAFADSTSANETYGAGRYLDLKKTPGATSITLDFNNAYNPYCAYSDAFSCPFPPKENVLKTAVRAGEKKYHD